MTHQQFVVLAQFLNDIYVTLQKIEQKIK